jgi:hypothetical protein
LARVLIRLIANGVTIKMGKSYWEMKKLPLLGHLVLCKNGVAADPGKVEAMAAMAPPTLVHEVRTFLGAS